MKNGLYNVKKKKRYKEMETFFFCNVREYVCESEYT